MRKAIRIPLLAVSLIVLVAGTVLATAGPSGLAGTFVSRGIVTERVHFNTGEVKVQTKAPVGIISQTIAFAAPSTSGWHAHPGVVLVTVTAGSLTRYDENCASTVYPAGSAFIESGDHPGLVRNESSTLAAAVNVTYLVPAGITTPTDFSALRIHKDNPGCPKS